MVAAVLNRPTLVLNRNWQPVGIATVAKSLTKVWNDTARIVDPADYQQYTWDDWSLLRPAGDDLFIGSVTSYFREPATFPMVLDIPADRHLKNVRELVMNKDVPVECEEQSARIQVRMGFDTPAMMYVFEIA